MTENILYELNRIERVVNMMITMHSILRDRFKRYSLIVDISLLVSAILLNALIFIDFKYLKPIFNDEISSKIAIGFFSILVFITSIVILTVDWKQKSENHSQAVKILFTLLSECRQIQSIEDESEKKSIASVFHNKYLESSNAIVPIPDKNFNKFKAIHLQKVELSKLISKNPGHPVILLRIYILFSSIKKFNND